MTTKEEIERILNEIEKRLVKEIGPIDGPCRDILFGGLRDRLAKLSEPLNDAQIDNFIKERVIKLNVFCNNDSLAILKKALFNQLLPEISKKYQGKSGESQFSFNFVELLPHDQLPSGNKPSDKPSLNKIRTFKNIPNLIRCPECDKDKLGGSIKGITKDSSVIACSIYLKCECGWSIGNIGVSFPDMNLDFYGGASLGMDLKKLYKSML